MAAPANRSKRAVLRRLIAAEERFRAYYGSFESYEAFAQECAARPEVWALYRWVERALQAQGVDLDAPTALQ